jgi:hypothetical protein
VDWIDWLHELGRDAEPETAGFQAGAAYVAVAVAMPIAIGLVVGFGLRLIESVLGVQLGKGGH